MQPCSDRRPRWNHQISGLLKSKVEKKPIKKLLTVWPKLYRSNISCSLNLSGSGHLEASGADQHPLLHTETKLTDYIWINNQNQILQVITTLDFCCRNYSYKFFVLLSLLFVGNIEIVQWTIVLYFNVITLAPSRGRKYTQMWYDYIQTLRLFCCKKSTKKWILLYFQRRLSKEHS